MTIVKRILIMSLILSLPLSCFAMKWEDLWLRPDQQGAKSLAQGKPGLAAQQFKNPSWKAVAEYRAGHYQQAVTTLEKLNSTSSHYNRGNALAQMGDYREAIEAYSKSLQLDPNNKDAKFNKELLEKLLKQKQPKNKKQKSQSNDDKKGKDKQKRSSKTKSEEKKNNSKQGSHKKQEDKGRKDKANPSHQNQPEQQRKQDHGKNQNKQSKADPKNQSQADPNKDKKDQKSTGTKHDPKNKTQTMSPKQREQYAQKQADKQWLKQIPDDPGGLLKRKFQRDYQRMQENERGNSW